MRARVGSRPMSEHDETTAGEAPDAGRAPGADPDHEALHSAETQQLSMPTERIDVRAGERAGRGDDGAGRHREEPPPPRRLPGHVIEDGPDGPGPAPYVTVVLPCYNEGAHVLREIERISAALDASEHTYELLCIDDASTDDTLDVLRDAMHHYPHVRVLPFRRNGGSGTARRIGTQQARGEIVVWTDADMTYENERIPELVRFLRDDPTYDQVVGARTTECPRSGSSARSPSG
jgi:hypothetical protein